jgi:hypothetical protein
MVENIICFLLKTIKKQDLKPVRDRAHFWYLAVNKKYNKKRADISAIL